jgi:ecotin
MKTTALLALLTFAATASVHAVDNLKAFPPADDGMTRFVINLPKDKDEPALKVELLVGRTVRTDAANRYFFGGALETETIAGWGFDRHILRKLGPMAGTLMAVDPKAPQVDRFITLAGEPQLLRYNSQLPLVVYVPNDVEVRYRIWRAGATTKKAAPG